MDAPNLDSLPPHVTQQVKDLVARGNKIEAIKIFRSATGLGLKESKDVIDAISAGNAQAANQLMMGMGASSPQTPAAAGDTLAQVRQLMRADEKIQAIRVLRAASGLGLKDAKDAVEALVAGNDQPVQSALAQRRAGPPTVASMARPVLPEVTEASSSGVPIWVWIVAALVTAAIVYSWWRQ